MATARKKAHTSRQVDRARAAKSGSMEFVVFEDNDGDYHWTIIAASGETLAQSPSFASYAEAEMAAGRVRDDAGSARLARRDGVGLAVDLDARRAAVHAAFDLEQGTNDDDHDSHPSAAVAVAMPADQ
jgi:uncharacterized protein YegP (UPF0339 family)